MKKIAAYLIITLISAYIIFKQQKYIEHVAIGAGYSQPFCVDAEDKIFIYTQPIKKHKQSIIYIYDIRGKTVDSIICNLKFQHTIHKEKLARYGLGYDEPVEYKINQLPAGVYFVEKDIPFVVHDNKHESDITVIIPYLSLQAKNNYGLKSFYAYNSENDKPETVLSLERPFTIDAELLTFYDWLTSCYPNKKINFCTELQFQKANFHLNSKLIIIAGNSPFWTLEGRRKFDSVVQQGTQVMLISALCMNNKIKVNKYEKKIIFSALHDSTVTGVWNDSLYNYPTFKSVGCDYKSGIISKEVHKGFLKVNLPKHKIFRNYNADMIPLNVELLNSISFFKNSEGIFPKDDVNFTSNILAYDFHKYKSLTGVGGILEFTTKNQGSTILVIGSQDWLLKENFSKPGIKTITKNCIEYLLEKK
jgi:hypothetical protein